jgi:hypothetical protein
MKICVADDFVHEKPADPEHGTQRAEEPVSKSTLNCCCPVGLPTEITPKYWV